ncbi:MAG: DUF86 domain-containing protein [archaeon]|nr:DUF86 domain-containing protein [archaeon]
MKLEAEYLDTILDYCGKIQSDIEFFGDSEEFLENERYQRAVTFCLLQIGEVVKHLRDSFGNRYSDKYWKKIAGLRDVVCHGYESVDQAIIWTVIEKDIPELVEKCKAIKGDSE